MMWHHSDLEEKDTPGSNVNQPEIGNHTQNTQYCRHVYSDLEKSPWQHKSFVFTQVFVMLCRSHKKFLTFRQISHHTNHKLLCYWASTHLLRQHRKLLTQRFLVWLKPRRITMATQPLGSTQINHVSMAGRVTFNSTQAGFCSTLLISQRKLRQS